MNHYTVSACCHPAFPVTLGFAHVLCNTKIVENIKNKIDNSEWGNPYPFVWESDGVYAEIMPEISNTNFSSLPQHLMTMP